MKYLANKLKKIAQSFSRRKHRVNTKIKTVSDLPRVIIDKSNMHIRAQLVDASGKVVGSIRDKKAEGSNKTEKALNAGKEFAAQIKKSKISKVAFDRNGHLYHGRVKAFAQGLREGGLKL